MSTDQWLDARFDACSGVGLDEVAAAGASLQTRVDRKYVVDRRLLTAALDRVADEGVRPGVLDIDGNRSFRYRSVYFDTPSFGSYLDAARGRPSRFKVRTRTYVDTGTTWIEVKLRDRFGRTVKHRRPHDPSAEHRLTSTAVAFLDRFETVRPAVADLRPTLRTSYRRSTLVADQRVTIDTDLRCDGLTTGGRGVDVVHPFGGVAAVGIGGFVVVETKSADSRPGSFDRVLWDLGVRPVGISKFGIGLAALRPDLPSNKWHRVLDRIVVPIDEPLAPPVVTAVRRPPVRRDDRVGVTNGRSRVAR